jgi:uncharacterized protein (TIGR03503 family)
MLDFWSVFVLRLAQLKAMSYLRSLLLSALITGILSLSTAQAQSNQLGNIGNIVNSGKQATFDSNQTRIIDVVVLLDSSGSMLATDPNTLRYEATKLFISLLSKEDRVALYEFDEEAREISPLKSISEQSSILEKLNAKKAEGKFTDINKGIQKALDVLLSTSRSNATKLIVVLTDGKLEAPSSRGTRLGVASDLENNILPLVVKNNIIIHTVSFSKNADDALLSKITSTTGGTSWYNEDVGKIHESLTNVIFSSKRPQVLEEDAHGFFIDELVEEATFYVDKDPNSQIILSNPEGKKFNISSNASGIKWFEGSAFDIITVNEPLAGTWKVSGSKEKKGFATLLTKLELVAKWPDVVDPEKQHLISAKLLEDTKLLDLGGLNSIIDYTFELFSTDKVAEAFEAGKLQDSGKGGDKEKNDGIFSTKIKLPGEGNFKLRIVAHSPTFERELHLPFKSIRSPLKFEIHDHKHKKQISVKLRSEFSSTLRLSSGVLVVDNNGEKEEVKFKKSKSVLSVEQEFSLPGKYKLYAKVKAFEKSGNKLFLKSKTVKFTIKASHHEEEEVVEEVDNTNYTTPFFVLLAIVSLWNCGFAFFIFRKIKKNLTPSSSSNNLPQIPEGLTELLKELEKKANETSIDLSDQSYRQIAETPETKIIELEEDLQEVIASENFEKSDPAEVQ